MALCLCYIGIKLLVIEALMFNSASVEVLFTLLQITFYWERIYRTLLAEKHNTPLRACLGDVRPALHKQWTTL